MELEVEQEPKIPSVSAEAIAEFAMLWRKVPAAVRAGVAYRLMQVLANEANHFEDCSKTAAKAGLTRRAEIDKSICFAQEVLGGFVFSLVKLADEECDRQGIEASVKP